MTTVKCHRIEIEIINVIDNRLIIVKGDTLGILFPILYLDSF
jgi:hypothetical protein